ncbi:hypothetical protein HEK616_55360 [Streptomyces nigrescens]|uniref:Uncharacterized protein n=1 Tax=Streptomyces nigrescens TaxID=1920 RepID=A0ABM8A0A4_STRNI|nr:hypothetical protein HEK616_55360 [Streptomyces nigrescens]
MGCHVPGSPARALGARAGDGCDGGAEAGGGLPLVAALADAWGAGERVPGKGVWCEFRGEGEGEGECRIPRYGRA